MVAQPALRVRFFMKDGGIDFYGKEIAYERALALEPDDSRANNELARVRWGWNGSGGAGLARAAGGFARALRADPRAAVSRANIDVVLQNFLGADKSLDLGDRVHHLLAARPWRSGGATSSAGLLLIFPVIFAVRFASELEPSLRAFLVRRCRDALLATTVVCLSHHGVTGHEG